MSWLRIDDCFPDHPKIARLGPSAPLAGWLHVCALCYCSRYLTDGVIPREQVSRLSGFGDLGASNKAAETLAEELVSVGLWHRHKAGYRIHDYLDYNPSRKDVLSKRKDNAQRQEDYRKRQTERNAVSNALRNGPVTLSPSPTPTTKSSTTKTRYPDVVVERRGERSNGHSRPLAIGADVRQAMNALKGQGTHSQKAEPEPPPNRPTRGTFADLVERMRAEHPNESQAEIESRALKALSQELKRV